MFKWAQFSMRAYPLRIAIILFLAFLIVTGTSLSLQRIVHGTLLRVAEQKAMNWAHDFTEQIPDLRQLASTGTVTDKQLELINAMTAGGDIFKFKLYSPTGEIKYISGDEQSPEGDGVNHSAIAKSVFNAMVSNISVKNGEDNPNRPDTFVEAYIPAQLTSGEYFGVVEVYVDVSTLAANLTETLRTFGTFLIFGIATICLVPSIILIFQKRKVDDAQTREAWLAAILYHAPFEVVIKDVNGNIKAISRNVVEEFDLNESDFIGKTTVDFLPKEIAKLYMDADKQVIKTGNASQDEVTETVDGRTRYSLSSKFPLVDSKGRTTGICSITNDISEMKKSEDALAQAQKMEAVGQLTGGIAHDFNNLLAIIMWSAEELQTKYSRPDDSVETILQTVEKGAILTQQLLSFSRRQNLKPQIIDVRKLVLDLSEMLERTLGETVEISTEFSPDLRHAFADPNQLENALLNLALNARDAMPKGGKLLVDCHIASAEELNKFEDTPRGSGSFVVLAVKDNGAGMSKETLHHAFEPFYTTKGVGRGSGLGLSMVYGFAQQSNGRINVESNLGEGTTVNLYLPCATQQSIAQKGATTKEEIQLNEMSILLVEDDPQVRKLAQRLLEVEGHRVMSFRSAPEARSVFDGKHHFDVLLSDVVLPGGFSGPEFSKEMRQHFPDVKVVFMSGYPRTSLQIEDNLANDLNLLNKPFDRKALVSALA